MSPKIFRALGHAAGEHSEPDPALLPSRERVREVAARFGVRVV